MTSKIKKEVFIRKYSKSGVFRVSQVDLPNPGQDWISGNAIVSGWGRLSSGGESPDRLQSVVVPIVSDDGKKKFYYML